MAVVTARERNGRKFWEARVTVARHKPKSKTFPENRKTEALRWANDLEARLRRGEKISALPGKTKIPDLVEDWWAENIKWDEDGYPLLDEETSKFVWEIPPWKRYASGMAAHFLKEFTVEDLTPAVVDAWLKKLKSVSIPKQKRGEDGKAHSLYNGDAKRTYSDSAIRKHFHALKDAVTWHARRHGYDVGERFDVKKLPASWSEPRERRLVDDEEERLLAACSGMYKDPEGWRLLIRVELATAMRAQEILGLLWSEVNATDDGVEFIGLPGWRTKTGEPRTIPLGPEGKAAIAALRARRSPDDPRVFWTLPSNTSSMGLGFKRITKRAGIEDLTFHDLRHESTARFFERTSMRQLEIAMVTGHSNPATLKRYANLRPEFLLKQLEQPGKFTSL
jgi:integrase